MTRTLVIGETERAELNVKVDDAVYVFPVRFGADLDVDIMAEVLELQLEMRRYGSKESKIPDWVRRAKRLVFDVIAIEHPDEEAFERVKSRSWSASELLQVLFLLSGRSEEEGGAIAEVAAGLATDAPDTGEPGSRDPTTSPSRSRRRRSKSERSSASARAGGEESHGDSSDSTSPMPTAA